MREVPTTPEAERSLVIEFLFKCRDHWREESRRLHKNPHAAAHCTAKAIVLDGAAKDIRGEFHLKEST